MKTLILDESKWRCGQITQEPNNRRGIGSTGMINDQDYMCCLGQFSIQLNKEVKLGVEMSEPSNIEMKVPFLNKKQNGEWINTKLSTAAININDDENTTVEQKVVALKKLFKSKGLRVVFRKIKK